MITFQTTPMPLSVWHDPLLYIFKVLCFAFQVTNPSDYQRAWFLVSSAGIVQEIIPHKTKQQQLMKQKQRDCQERTSNIPGIEGFHLNETLRYLVIF